MRSFCRPADSCGTSGSPGKERLAALAGAEQEAESEEAASSFAGWRRPLQKLTLWLSQLSLLISLIVVVLAVLTVNARAG
jgi:preprotein translocase subunit SecG